MTPRLLRAIQAHGVRPEGYCFCAPNRIGDAHQGECVELQAAIAEAEQEMNGDLAPHTAREIEEADADLKRVDGDTLHQIELTAMGFRSEAEAMRVGDSMCTAFMDAPESEGLAMTVNVSPMEDDADG